MALAPMELWSMDTPFVDPVDAEFEPMGIDEMDFEYTAFDNQSSLSDGFQNYDLHGIYNEAIDDGIPDLPGIDSEGMQNIEPEPTVFNNIEPGTTDHDGCANHDGSFLVDGLPTSSDISIWAIGEDDIQSVPAHEFLF